MLNVKLALQGFAIIAFAATLSACKNGGDLSLEPGARKVVSQGSPFVQVNNGGKALIYEATRTPATATQGVHGWVTVQAITSQQLTGAGGTTAVMNRAQSGH